MLIKKLYEYVIAVIDWIINFFYLKVRLRYQIYNKENTNKRIKNTLTVKHKFKMCSE